MARGAPSQHTQPSRHNKKSWRKNINIDDVEDALENIRSEEIVTGSAFHKKPNEELFTVDLLGDESVRKTLPPAPTPKSINTLTSLKILSQRSALPPIYSRPKTQIPKSEKHRLLRIAKKPIKGPFGVIIDTPPLPPASLSTIDPTEFYDPWSQAPSETPNPDVEMNTNPNPSRLAPKKPPTTTSALPNSTTATTTAASLPAVPKPHSGTSYNPLLSSHLSLLHTAAEQESLRLKESEKGRDVKERILAALGGQRDDEEGVVMGMVVDPVARGAHAPQAGVQAEGEGEEGEGEREGAGEGVAKKTPQRKTRQQRLRASRLVKEKRVLAERAFKKRQLGYLAALPLRARARARAAQAQAKPPSGSTSAGGGGGGSRFGLGIAGQRIGKHRVPEGLVDVQIGEELSESLRGLKPEGNLFKDRFVNLQQRALVEPRIRVLPKRRKNRVVEYEKHAWKRFDRDQERMQM